MSNGLELGMALGYWWAVPPTNIISSVVEAEKLGYDSVWTAEAYGSDALSPLAYVASHTSRIKLGTSVVQLSARTPVATAMAAMTIDHLSNGRMMLGLGVSGPQVVEGWYGQPFKKPLARTREYIDIIKQVLRREEPVTNDGPHYPLPYHGEGATDLGKPLKSITHPLRPEIPIYMGAEGPKNIALCAEIADGWLPLFYSPFREDVYAASLEHAKPDFEIAQLIPVNVHDDLETALAPVKAFLALYVGGMGAKDQNFHNALMGRMGFEKEAEEIQDLYLAGKKAEAMHKVPDAFADEISLCGPIDRIRDRLDAWRESRVTTLLIGNQDETTIRQMAELVLS